MENDIDIEEVSKSTTLRQERLRKVKNNIEAMQKKMNSKNIGVKGEAYRSYVPKQIISVQSKKYRQEQNQQNVTHKEFEFNSNLFKHIPTQSQQVLENGSAVSNFSSVSNINNILNGNRANEAPKAPQQSSKSIMQDIDKILQKVNKASSKMPVKAFGKYLDIKQQKQRNQIPTQGLDYSIISQKSGQFSARTKLQEYKKFIAELEPIQEFGVQSKSEFGTDNQMASINPFIKQKSPLKDISVVKSHKKSGLSNFSVKSQFALSENNYIRLPPTPPSQPRKETINPVDRQKAIIKQTMHEYKKLQTQKNSELLDRSIDFELSDEESDSNTQRGLDKGRMEELLHEKAVLQQQLLRIQSQLSKLQNQE